KVVKKLTRGVSSLLKGNGVDQLVGTATLIGPHEVAVQTQDGERTITADHIVLATGSSPIEIPGFPFSDERVLDSTGALALNSIPEKLVVIGGGYIGLELGGMYARLGAKVTVVPRSPWWRCSINSFPASTRTW
ncbi:MAG: FAD-dependent oxidoreductase, partial [Deltaproteobacteria bacterium]|nr:FAD-dependent oxidoreductase [Deltaproteobacteria bacterium]